MPSKRPRCEEGVIRLSESVWGAPGPISELIARSESHAKAAAAETRAPPQGIRGLQFSLPITTELSKDVTFARGAPWRLRSRRR